MEVAVEADVVIVITSSIICIGYFMLISVLGILHINSLLIVP